MLRPSSIHTQKFIDIIGVVINTVNIYQEDGIVERILKTVNQLTLFTKLNTVIVQKPNNPTKGKTMT